MPRMAREWHPIEEFTALMTVTRLETNHGHRLPKETDCYQYCDFILIFQRASKAGEVPAAAVRLNLFATADCQRLPACSRQLECFWEAAKA